MEKETVKKIIKDCSEELDQMYDMLMKLKELELLIKKREELEKAIESVHISFVSIEIMIKTMEERINKVKLIYEKDVNGRGLG